MGNVYVLVAIVSGFLSDIGNLVCIQIQERKKQMKKALIYN